MAAVNQQVLCFAVLSKLTSLPTFLDSFPVVLCFSHCRAPFIVTWFYRDSIVLGVFSLPFFGHRNRLLPFKAQPIVSPC